MVASTAGWGPEGTAEEELAVVESGGCSRNGYQLFHPVEQKTHVLHHQRYRREL